MRVEDTHILKGEEVIYSCSSEVFDVLTDIPQQYQRYAPGVQSIKILTPSMPFGKGFQWRETRRVLYLREDCNFTVKEYNVDTKTLRVCMNDGFNMVFYHFTVKDCGPECCQVSYNVDCRLITDSGSQTAAAQPSERLARMMAKQDGQLVKCLKAHIESSSAVPCC